MDWIATNLALRAVVPILALLALLIPGTNPADEVDEVKLSLELGLPSWLVPCLLSSFGALVAIAVIRLHARGARLIPFAAAFLGNALGPVIVVAILIWRGQME